MFGNEGISLLYLSSIRARINESSSLLFLTHWILYTWKETSSAASWQDNLG